MTRRRVLLQTRIARHIAALLNHGPALIEAAREALDGMPGGHDAAICHNGITTRAKCCQCRRKDGLRTALAPFAEVAEVEPAEGCDCPACDPPTEGA